MWCLIWGFAEVLAFETLRHQEHIFVDLDNDLVKKLRLRDEQWSIKCQADFDLSRRHVYDFVSHRLGFFIVIIILASIHVDNLKVKLCSVGVVVMDDDSLIGEQGHHSKLGDAFDFTARISSKPRGERSLVFFCLRRLEYWDEAGFTDDQIKKLDCLLQVRVAA